MTTPGSLLLARRGDARPGLRAGDRTWTWDEVVRESLLRGAVLRRLGLADPAHVGVLLENTPEHAFWIGGAALAGGTLVGGNLTRRGDALGGDLRHTDCRALVVGPGQRALLDDVDTGVPADQVHIVGSDAYAALLDDARADADAAYDEPWAAPDPTRPMLLLFTSGSTGAPKAVVCSHGRLGTIALRSNDSFGLTRDDVAYISMPMFHGNAIMACWAPALSVGATVALRERFSASGWIDDVRRYGATYTTYVGRALAYVLATPPGPDDRDNPLRLAFGTEASARDREAFTARFDVQILENYGSSEGVIAIHRVPGTPDGALGLPQPRPGADVAIVDPETGEECPRAVIDANGTPTDPACIGELVDRGGAPGFEGYWRNPEASSERLRDGWYWSGDLGYRDVDGWFWFAGRSSDWLRVDSENFAAAPVERILARSERVLLAAVYGVPDPETGDQVMAALELLPGEAFDPDAFAAFLSAQADLGTKWAPRFIRIVASMPVTGTNKIDKNPLRRAAWETADPVWWEREKGAGYARLTPEERTALRDRFTAAGRAAFLPPPLT
ncbi:MAG TPA: AMP-binding protein [Mycobacteriales bacterium]|nr:AMP-binding protein [Mycobacteriales bacterium]